MAALVNSGKTGLGAATTLNTAGTAPSKFTTPAAGNLLVMGMVQQNSVSEPVPKDSLGTAGWTLIKTAALNFGSANSAWIAYKVAVGTETELLPTLGGTGQGIWYEEWSGLAAELDGSPVHTDNQASGKAITSPGLTTTNAASVVFAVVGDSNGAFGKVSAWAPAGMTTIAPETSSRIIGASHIPGTTLSEQTYKAEWETARVSGILVVAFKPAEGTTPANIVFNAAAAKGATSGALTAPANVSGAAAATAASAGALTAPANVSGIAQTSAAASGALSAPANVSGIASANAAASATITAPANIIASASQSRAAASGALTAPALLIASPATSQAGASGTLSAPAFITAAPASALASAIGSLTTGGAAIIAFGTVSGTASASGSFFAPEVAAHHPPRRRPTIGNVAVGDRGRLTRQEGGRAV